MNRAHSVIILLLLLLTACSQVSVKNRYTCHKFLFINGIRFPRYIS